MKALNRNTAVVGKYTERMIQFGEGGFLRAFVDWMLARMNAEAGFDCSAVIVQPRAGGHVDRLVAQDCLYHVNLQGLQNGETVDSMELVDSVSRGVNPYADFEAYLALAEQPQMRFVVSNTTEAGIAFDASCRFSDRPASSYPGKLVQLLYHRYEHFGGAPDKGLVIMPCELIFHNADALRDCIHRYIGLWQLGDGFRTWFDTACVMYNTLVDRIVPGYPRDAAEALAERTGFDDAIMVQGEAFHLWVIEAPASFEDEFPARRAGLNVLFVPSEAPYHRRKVALLNGPHTVMSPVGYLCGLDTVRECCEDPDVSAFVRRVMYDELMPTLDLPEEELRRFASDVMERFRNPFIKHSLTGIMLNSFAKYRTRDLPALKSCFASDGKLPDGLVMGLAALVTYYKGGKRGYDVIRPDDAPEILALLTSLWNSADVNGVADGVLGAVSIWGEDLRAIPGLVSMLSDDLAMIADCGMRAAIKNLLK